MTDFNFNLQARQAAWFFFVTPWALFMLAMSIICIPAFAVIAWIAGDNVTDEIIEMWRDGPFMGCLRTFPKEVRS